MAFTGAGQTAWHTPHPVQSSGFTIGIPWSMRIAPATGQRSKQEAQKEVSARHWRPSTTATVEPAS
jgi:hypothetical protein